MHNGNTRKHNSTQPRTHTQQFTIHSKDSSTALPVTPAVHDHNSAEAQVQARTAQCCTQSNKPRTAEPSGVQPYYAPTPPCTHVRSSARTTQQASQSTAQHKQHSPRPLQHCTPQHRCAHNHPGARSHNKNTSKHQSQSAQAAATKARPDPHSTESHGTANTRTLSGVQTTQATHTRAQHCAPTTHGTELAQHCKTSPARQRTITPIMHERTHAQHNTRAHWRQHIARTPNRAHTDTCTGNSTSRHGSAHKTAHRPNHARAQHCRNAVLPATQPNACKRTAGITH